MSMISSQCDELRDWACELRKLANGPVNEGFPAREKLFESADAMCQAADTILELREMAQKANAENAKLREILKSLMMGTNAELCAVRGESDCKECSMYHGEDGCNVVNAMELLGIDMYGEPLRIEVE